MAEITLKAYIPGEEEYQECFKKFPAFMSAKLSERAKKEETFAYGNNGYFPMRTSSHEPNRIICVNYNGSRIPQIAKMPNAGLRVAMQVMYTPESSIVKSTKNLKRVSTLYGDQEVTNEAPIVTFGKNEYIWFNKEECEAGKDATMKLCSLNLLAKAVPFEKDMEKGDYADFARATELQEQALQVATENCTEEELEMIVPVKMSDKDEYATAEPILPELKKEETVEEKKSVEGLFNDLASGKIDEETLRTELKKISKEEREKEGASEETAKALKEKIAEQAKIFNEALKEKEKIEKSFDDVDKSIDDLQLGGK